MWREVLVGQSAVVDVPTEGGQFHGQDHLCTGDVDERRVVDHVSVDMVDGHVAHHEYKADPWHEGALDIFCYEIGSNGANE